MAQLKKPKSKQRICPDGNDETYLRNRFVFWRTTTNGSTLSKTNSNPTFFFPYPLKLHSNSTSAKIKSANNNFRSRQFVVLRALWFSAQPNPFQQWHNLRHPKLLPANDLRQSNRVDCGVFVMHFTKQLSQGLPMEDRFAKEDVYKFRAHVASTMIKNKLSWNSREANNELEATKSQKRRAAVDAQEAVDLE